MKATFFHRKCMLLAGLLIFSMSAAKAHEDNEADKTLSPYFVVISENPETDQLPLKETSVSANIVGSIADVTVRLCDYPNYPDIDIKIILESLEVEVDRTLSEITSAGKSDGCLAASSEKRAHKIVRSTDPGYERT